MQGSKTVQSKDVVAFVKDFDARKYTHQNILAKVSQLNLKKIWKD